MAAAAAAASEELCPICLKKISSKIYNYIKTACNHEFHLNCLVSNIQSGSSEDSELHEQTKMCPLCRAPLILSEILLKNVHEPESPKEKFQQILMDFNLSNDKENPRAGHKDAVIANLQQLLKTIDESDKETKRNVEESIKNLNTKGGKKRKRKKTRRNRKKTRKKKRRKQTRKRKKRKKRRK